MHWKLITKNKLNQPTTGTYSDWKEQIASECYHQCIYCAINEGRFGGIDHYHIEHYKPKSKFKALENDICNLFYACPICNKFKGDDWPCDDDDHNQVCYPNPSKVDYNNLFVVNSKYELIGNNTAARYVVHRLFLNRAQLIFERRESALRTKADYLIEEITSLVRKIRSIDALTALTLLEEIDKVKTNIIRLENKRTDIRPYILADIRKT